jgi:hypothetical protein
MLARQLTPAPPAGSRLHPRSRRSAWRPAL